MSIEESPGSTGKWCQLMAGEGDLRESATENKRLTSLQLQHT